MIGDVIGMLKDMRGLDSVKKGPISYSRQRSVGIDLIIKKAFAQRNLLRERKLENTLKLRSFLCNRQWAVSLKIWIGRIFFSPNFYEEFGFLLFCKFLNFKIIVSLPPTVLMTIEACCPNEDDTYVCFVVIAVEWLIAVIDLDQNLWG